MLPRRGGGACVLPVLARQVSLPGNQQNDEEKSWQVAQMWSINGVESRKTGEQPHWIQVPNT